MAARMLIIERCLDAAKQGNLTLLKWIANELDNGEGLEKTFTTVKDYYGRNALHFAASGGQTAICKYLVNEMKLDLHSKDEINGYSALHHAVAAGFVSTARYLIKIGSDVNLTCLGGISPLHTAASNGNVEMMELLISRGADVELLSQCDYTPLHMAAVSGKVDAVKCLLDHNANPNSTGANCISTPLILSISAKSLECVKLLVKAGADPNLVAGGTRPLFHAISLRQSGMVKFMLEHRGLCDYAAELGVDTSSGGSSAQYEEEGKDAFTESAEGEYYGRHTEVWFSEEAEFDIDSPCYGSSAICKEKGKDAFNNKEYHQAATWYTEAIKLDPTDETLFSNRSLCWIRLSKGDKALEDALACVKLKPNWPKAHYREGAAFKFLENYEKAVEAFGKALQLDPDNKETLKQLHEVQDMVLGVI